MIPSYLLQFVHIRSLVAGVFVFTIYLYQLFHLLNITRMGDDHLEGFNN